MDPRKKGPCNGFPAPPLQGTEGSRVASSRTTASNRKSEAPKAASKQATMSEVLSALDAFQPGIT